MADRITFGRDAARDIIATVRDWKSRGGLQSTVYDGDIETGAPQFRIGKTTTNADFPTYPTTGDTFVVALGELSWTAATGTQTNTWSAYSALIGDTRLCHDITGTYWPRNSYVELALHHGRWFIVGGIAEASGILIKTPVGGIPAIVVNTMGSATCQKIDTNATGTICFNGTVLVYNITRVAVGGYCLGKASRVACSDGSSSILVVDVESCVADSPGVSNC